jgi:hypothetical protein
MTDQKQCGWKECVVRIVLEFAWADRDNHRKLQLGKLRFEPRSFKYEVADQ